MKTVNPTQRMVIVIWESTLLFTIITWSDLGSQNSGSVHVLLTRLYISTWSVFSYYKELFGSTGSKRSNCETEIRICSYLMMPRVQCLSVLFIWSHISPIHEEYDYKINEGSSVSIRPWEMQPEMMQGTVGCSHMRVSNCTSFSENLFRVRAGTLVNKIFMILE